MENKNFKVEEVHESSPASDIIIGGNTMMQAKTDYSAAIQIQKPRTLNKVILACEEEAAIAGDEFYYSWRQGGEIVEGLTIGAAQAIARNWGNCAVDVRVQETPTAYIFYAAFIDLETGFNLIRPFRQNKQSPKSKKGEEIYKGDRGMDIIFQIGASKATRNVVLNAVPRWLGTKVMNRAKENVKSKIESMGIPAAISKIIKKAEALKVPVERIESAFGKQSAWDIERLVLLMGALRSIEDGFETVDSLFPFEKDESKDQNEKQQGTQVNQNGSSTAKPKIQSVQVGENETKEPINLSPVDWENPIRVIAKIESLKTLKELAEFKKENKQRLTTFSGKDHDSIQKALVDQEQKIKSGQ